MTEPKGTPITDLSRPAVSIAREVDRLPAGQVAAIYITKDDKGQITRVEVYAQERLRSWAERLTVAM